MTIRGIIPGIFSGAINAEISGDLIPATDSSYDVGSLTKRWAFMFADEITIGDIVISGSTISGDVTISGDLNVSGTTTTIDTIDLLVTDNIITVNNGEVGAGVTAGSAGIQVDRGTETDYQFLFVESSDTFKVGEVANLQSVATREDSPIATAIAYWNSAQARFDTTTDMTYSSGITSLNQLYLTVDLAVAHGGTGASTATGARANLGLGAMATENAVTLTGDVTGSGTGSFATTIANGAVTNAKVNATAAIDHSKMAALTASRAMVTNGSGFASVSSVTATELGYVSGVTSAIQTQLNGKASLSHTHDAGNIVSGILPVARGGTGVGTLTADRVIRGNGTSPVISSGVIVNSSDEMYGFRRRIENKTGTTYTLLSTDTGKLITTTAGSQIDITCPNNLPVGSIFFFIQMGSGKIQLVAAAGATLRQRNNHYRTSGQYARMAARVVTNSTGTNAEYVVDGDVA